MATDKTPKGGRGLTAPYQTTHLRIPIGMKRFVQEQIDDYKQQVLSGKIPPDHEYRYIPTNNLASLPPIDIILPEVEKILKRKKGAKDALSKLLTSLYGFDVMEYLD